MNKLLLIFSVFVCSTIILACQNNTGTKNDTSTSEIETDVANVEEPPKSWLNFEYDSVNLYLYNLDKNHQGPNLIAFNNTINKSVVESITLDRKDIDRLKRIVDHAPEFMEVAECFEPHHGVVFFKGDSVVQCLSICTMCNNTKDQNGYINVDSRSIERLIKSKGLPIFRNMEDISKYQDEVIKQ